MAISVPLDEGTESVPPFPDLDSLRVVQNGDLDAVDRGSRLVVFRGTE